ADGRTGLFQLTDEKRDLVCGYSACDPDQDVLVFQHGSAGLKGPRRPRTAVDLPPCTGEKAFRPSIPRWRFLSASDAARIPGPPESDPDSSGAAPFHLPAQRRAIAASRSAD